ncbi:Ig-like domain-containing protein [Tenacibaculum sp. MEBiC06402]|uniref:Ig-like domain-containing protein n=1 Tax=unclassified Tenacibaculum TaxID=2635139 RepID=UPI003B9C00DA
MRIKLLIFSSILFLSTSCTKNNDSIPPLSEIALDKVEIIMNVTNTEQISITTDIGNSEVNWTSNNEEIATVDENGNIIAKNSGNCTITARVNDVSSSCNIIVNTTLFVSGYESNTNKSKLWLNSDLIELGNGNTSGVTVKSGKSYVVGTASDGYDKSTAKLWINDEEQNISNFGTYASSTSIFLKDNDVYISGQIEGASYSIATYWKNNEKINITDGNHQAWAYDLFVTNSNDIYTVGTESNDNLVSIATVWKNNIPQRLSSVYSGAYSIHEENNNIYVGGFEYNSSSGKTKAVVWQNGTPTYFTTGHFNAGITDVTINNGEVYCAGYSVDNSQLEQVATLWVNGFPTYLTDGSFKASATAVKVFNNDVYVIGRIWNGTKYNGIVWKNGIVIKTIDKFSNNIHLTGIEIK